jgi:hypothetical protein
VTDESEPGKAGQDIRAKELAELLETQVFDPEGAARFLGLARNSIEYAAYRKRIPFVQFGAKKLFTRADLMDYAANRGRGRESRLEAVAPYVVNQPEWDKLFGPGKAGEEKEPNEPS